jgi:transposase
VDNEDGKLNEEFRFMQHQIKQLEKEIAILRHREHEIRNRQAQITEMRDFLNQVKLFMLRLMQGYVEFETLVEHLGHKVNERELRKLYDATRSQPQHLSRRALTVLYHLYGIGNKTIMEFLYISRNTVKRYIHKFNDFGVDKLLDTSKTVPKVADDLDIKEAILSILHSPPKEFNYNRTSWTLKLLKQELENQGYHVGKNNVSLIVRKAGYRFWKAKEVLTSNDPKYKEKLEAITRILLNLKPSERFFSIDEFGPFAVRQRGGRRLVPRGVYPTVPQFQKSKGSLIVTAALELSTNQVIHFYSTHKNSDEIIKMLHILISKYSDCSTIYLSWDHSSWHSSKVLFSKINDVNENAYRSQSNTPVVKLAPLPSRSQFLNVIESVFSGMAAAIIQNSDYESVTDAKKAIDRYLGERNEYFQKYPKRAGNKIWGNELVVPVFKIGQNCKNHKWR